MLVRIGSRDFMIQRNLKKQSECSWFGTYSNDYAKWSIRGSTPGRGKKYFASLKGPNRPWASPPNLLFNGFRGPFPRTRLGHETDYSPAPTEEAKNERSYTYTPPTHLRDVHRNNFTFCLIVKINLLKIIKV